MNYTLRLPNNETVTVDETTGTKIKERLLSGERDGFFKAENSLYAIRDVKGITAEHQSKVKDFVAEHEEQIQKFEQNLARYATEDLISKVKREIKTRIKPCLKYEPVSGWQEVANTLGRFFRENPKYPWCPFTTWALLVFKEGDHNIDSFYQSVVRHDIRVREWVEGRKQGVLEPKKEQSVVEFFGEMLGGDLDD